MESCVASVRTLWWGGTTKKLEKGGKRSRALDWPGSQYVSGILTGQAAGLGVDPEDIWSSLQKLVCEGETSSEGCMQQ